MIAHATLGAGFLRAALVLACLGRRERAHARVIRCVPEPRPESL